MKCIFNNQEVTGDMCQFCAVMYCENKPSLRSEATTHAVLTNKETFGF